MVFSHRPACTDGFGAVGGAGYVVLAGAGVALDMRSPISSIPRTFLLSHGRYLDTT
jgi:hypothetical protein